LALIFGLDGWLTERAREQTMQIRSIRISAAAEWRGSAQQASLQVALHVTKRQHGA